MERAFQRSRSERTKARSSRSARWKRRRCRERRRQWQERRQRRRHSLSHLPLSFFPQKTHLNPLTPPFLFQTTPVAVGVAVGAAAYAAKFAIEAYVRIRSMPKSRNFYKGGFLPEMTRREAALILGLREGAQEARVRDAHRRIMIANHPDAGGSSYLATKVNEAKEMLMGGKGKRSGGGSAF